jgi:hypothetical protein
LRKRLILIKMQTVKKTFYNSLTKRANFQPRSGAGSAFVIAATDQTDSNLHCYDFIPELNYSLTSLRAALPIFRAALTSLRAALPSLWAKLPSLWAKLPSFWAKLRSLRAKLQASVIYSEVFGLYSEVLGLYSEILGASCFLQKNLNKINLLLTKIKNYEHRFYS